MGFLYLIRHARSTANQHDVLVGRSGRHELNSVGVAQAVALAERLREQGIARIRVSPLLRAQQTAAILAEHGLPAAVTDDDLTERDFGPFEGLDRPALLAARQRAGLDNTDPTGWFPPGTSGVETLGEVCRRAEAAVRAVRADDDAPVALITHAGLIKGYLYGTLGVPEHVPRAFKIFQASYVRLKVTGPRLRTVHELWRNDVQ